MNHFLFISLLILMGCQQVPKAQNTKPQAMKTLETFLSEIPRYQNADIVENPKYNTKQYKTFFVSPENTHPGNRSIFMVKKAKEVFPTHNRNFFKSFMADKFASGELQKWDAVKFSEFYFLFGLHKDEKIISNQFKADRYKENFGDMKWKAPVAKVLKKGIRFKFYAVELFNDKITYYNILIKKDGTLERD